MIFFDEHKLRETIKCRFSHLAEPENSGSGGKVITNLSRKRYNRKYSDPRKQSVFINCKTKSATKKAATFHINVTPGRRGEEEKESIVIETDMRSSLILGVTLLLTIAATSIVQARTTRSAHTCGLGPGM